MVENIELDNDEDIAMDEAIEPDKNNVINENATKDINVADEDNITDKTKTVSENDVDANIEIELNTKEKESWERVYTIDEAWKKIYTAFQKEFGEDSPIPKGAREPMLRFSDSLDEAMMCYMSLDKIEEMNKHLQNPDFLKKNDITASCLMRAKATVPVYDADFKTQKREFIKGANQPRHLATIAVALRKTDSRFSDDSKEYKEFCASVSNATAEYMEFICNPLEDPDKWENAVGYMKKLEIRTNAYLQHCEKNPKRGARREERLKCANRAKDIVEAFNNNQTLREYLKDNIALRYYATLVVTGSSKLSPDDPKGFKEKYIGDNATENKRNGADMVKQLKAFKDIVASECDLDRLYAMYDDPLKTFKRITKAVVKGDSKESKATLKGLKDTLANKNNIAPAKSQKTNPEKSNARPVPVMGAK